MVGDADVATIVCETLSSREDLTAVYLFGSVAEGVAHARSDVDVAVLFQEGLSAEAMFARSLEIGAALEAALRRPVDLVPLNRASPAFCFQVLKHGRLILERDPDARCLFVMHSLNRYYDLKPYLDFHQSLLPDRIRKEGLGRGYQGDRNALAEARRLSAKLASGARHPVCATDRGPLLAACIQCDEQPTNEPTNVSNPTPRGNVYGLQQHHGSR